MAKKSKLPAGVVILEPGDTPPKGAVMARWSARGPGYHPGSAAKWKGRVYMTPDFPVDVAAKWVRL
jgi:hypothetical protein